MAVLPRATLYTAHLLHKRYKPKAHGFEYSIWALKIDLAELGSLARAHLLGGNSPLSLPLKDFGPRDGSDLQIWLCRQLHYHGYSGEEPYEFLFLPRFKGRGFAPLSIWMTPHVYLFEVHNTAGEAHVYLAPENDLSQSRAWKRLWVSPFSPMHGQYKFTLIITNTILDVQIDLIDNQGLALTAHLTGSGEALTYQALHKVTRSPGLLGARSFRTIVLEALKIRWKGLHFQNGPFSPCEPVSVASISKTDSKQAPSTA